MKLNIKNTILAFTLALTFSSCASKIEIPVYEEAKTPQHLIKAKELNKGIYSLKSAKKINIKELVKEVEHYPVIFVGDYHASKETHTFFNNFLEELGKEGYKLNLVNEWFTPAHNKLLDSYINGEITLEQLKEKRKWKKFSIYQWNLVSQLYKTVKDNSGSLYGMNMTKEEKKKISEKQIDQMSKKEKNFFNSLDLNVSAHKSLVGPYFNHCKSKKDMEPCNERMYRVQVAWDTYMANEVNKLTHKIKNKKDKLIVFVGAMHMEYALGIPLRFSRLNNLPFYTITNEYYIENEDLHLDTNRSNSIFLYK